jgi:tetratricopeptide (TPR) repeat protein
MQPASRKLILIALTALLGACSTDPNKQKFAYLRDGERYLKAGKNQEAVIQLRNAVQLDPRFAVAYFQLGRAYLAIDNPEFAFRALTNSVLVDPTNQDAQLLRAGLLMKRHKFDEAQAVARNLIAAAPDNVQAHTILGEKHLLTKNFPTAIREFQAIVKLQPRAENYAALAAAYRAAGQSPEAEHTYRNGITANPKSVAARVALAQFYFAEGKLAEAESEMQAACYLDSNAIQPRLFLGRIYMVNGRIADAEQLYTELKTIAPDNPEAYEALGIFYLSVGHKEKAAAEFQSLLTTRRKDNTIKMYLVETWIELNRTKEARLLNDEILNTHPSDPRSLLANGRILLAEHQYEKALAEFQKVVKVEPGSAKGHYFLGLAQQSLGFPDLAHSCFARALELQPQMAQAAAALASLTAQQGDHEQALNLVNKAQTTGAELSSTYLATAQALLAKGDLRQAETALQRAPQRDAASLPALATLLNLYSREGRMTEGLRRLTGLMQQNPQNAGLHFLQAVAYFELKDLQKAERGVRQALTLDPKTPGAYTLLANIHFARGAVEDAKADLRAAMAAHPRSLSNYMALVTQYEKEKKWEEAKKLCEKAHAIDPNAPLIAAELAFLYLEHGGDVNAAILLAQAAKQHMPNSPITSDALGWAYYKVGSPDAAIAQLRESTARVPDNPIYQYHLALAYAASHRTDLAAQALRLALQHDPNFPYAASARAALAKLSKGGA